MNIELTRKPLEFNALLHKMEFLLLDDKPTETEYFTRVFGEIVSLLRQPFGIEEVDFSSKEYFAGIYALGDKVTSDKQFRKSNAARDSKHGIYINVPTSDSTASCICSKPESKQKSQLTY